MRVGRHAHESIVQGNFIIHIGGEFAKLNEIWEWKQNDGHFEIFDSELELTNWQSYPYVFTIPSA